MIKWENDCLYFFLCLFFCLNFLFWSKFSEVIFARFTDYLHRIEQNSLYNSCFQIIIFLFFNFAFILTHESIITCSFVCNNQFLFLSFLIFFLLFTFPYCNSLVWIFIIIYFKNDVTIYAKTLQAFFQVGSDIHCLLNNILNIMQYILISSLIK